MPRRSPRELRAETWDPLSPGTHVPQLPGISPAGLKAIAAAEQSFWSGAVVRSVHVWEAFARNPWHPRWERADGCGVPECCLEPSDAQPILLAVLNALPVKDARKLRHRLPDLEELSKLL